MRVGSSYWSVMHLNSNSLEKLKRWVNNQELSNSKAIIQHLLQFTIQTGVLRMGWGASNRGNRGQ